MKILLNNNKVLNMRLLFYVMTLSLLVGCEITRKPNFIKNGREYRIIGNVLILTLKINLGTTMDITS